MPLARVPYGQPNKEKPRGVVVRGQDSRMPWVWDGLCFAVPFTDSARDAMHNAAPAVTSGLAWTRDGRGNDAAYLGTSSYIEYPANPAHDRPSTAVTIYARILRVGTGETSGGIFCKRYGVDTLPYVSWAMSMDDFTADAVQCQLSLSDDTYENIRGGYVLPTNLWVSVFLRWQSGTAPTLYVLGERGEVLSAYTHVTMTGTIPYVAGEPILINAVQDVAVNADVSYSQVMLWDRVLTDAEVQALVADPFGWYSPRRQTLAVSGSYLFTAQTVMNGPAVAVPAR